MSDTFAIQTSYKHGFDGQDMTNIRGEDPDDFKYNLGILDDDETVERIVKGGTKLRGIPVNTAQAVANIQQAMPGSTVIESGDSFGFPPGQPPQSMTDRQRELTAKGFVFDKYGNLWHPTKFDQAPPCTCGGDKQNHGKLALKEGVNQQGKPFAGWFCANTFGRGAKSGCPAVFNRDYPEL